MDNIIYSNFKCCRHVNSLARRIHMYSPTRRAEGKAHTSFTFAHLGTSTEHFQILCESELSHRKQWGPLSFPLGSCSLSLRVETQAAKRLCVFTAGLSVMNGTKVEQIGPVQVVKICWPVWPQNSHLYSFGPRQSFTRDASSGKSGARASKWAAPAYLWPVRTFRGWVGWLSGWGV